MSIALWDVQAGCGGFAPGVPDVFSADDLAAELARLQIESALVQVAPDALDQDIVRSQDGLFDACRRHKNLLACPAVVPGDECGCLTDENAKIAGWIARGAVAVAIRPALDRWLLAEWISGPLMEALQDRRLPLVCQTDRVNLEQVATLAKAYPLLPIILTGVDYGSSRMLMPLMQRFGNLRVSTGTACAFHKGIETMVDRLGPERLLFGTGLPVVDAMMAVTYLMYAQIAEDDRRRIGSENLRDLIGGIGR